MPRSPGPNRRAGMAPEGGLAGALGEVDVSSGAQLRHDHIGTLGRYQTVKRQRVGVVREDAVRQTSAALYAEAAVRWTPWLRSTAGLRLDHVQARVTPTGGTYNAANGGHASAHRASPKLALASAPSTRWAAASSTPTGASGCAATMRAVQRPG